MGRNSFRFYINPKAVSIGDEVQIETPHTLTFQHGASVAVVEVRLPVKGERTWQCFTDAPLVSQMREMLTDWGGDGPGWEAKGDEENGKPSSTGEHDACYHVTVIAAFTLGDAKGVAWTSPPCVHYAGSPSGEHRSVQATHAALKAFATVTRNRISRPESPLVGQTAEVRTFLKPVIDAMNIMEESGGPSDADYLVIMESIANEARRRAETLKANLGKDLDEGDAAHTGSFPPPSCKVTIELEITAEDWDAASEAEVRSAVKHVLDSGALQDEINAYDVTVTVVSAVMS